MLCSSGTGYFQVAHGLTSPLNQLVPQTSSTTQTMIQGSSDIHTCARVGLAAGLGGGAAAAESSRRRSAGDVQICFGDHTCRNSARQAMEISEAPMSTIHGLIKFEIKNCGTAKETPVTRIAGQI